MRKYQKAALATERLELYLLRTCEYIINLLPEAITLTQMHQTRDKRTLELTFSIGTASQSEILAALDQGEEYLKTLAGVDADVSRTDKENEGILVSDLQVSLKDNPIDQYPDMQRRMAKERFDLTLYDSRTNPILDHHGIIQIKRMIYQNYGRMLWRIRHDYSREEWSSKIEELRATEPYADLETEILDQFDSIFLPEL